MSKTPPPSGVTITYQYQFRKCGKASCNTCKTSKGHGPYFYGYFRYPGQSKLSVYYYGKNDPRSDARKKQDAKKRELKQYSTVKAEATV